MLLLVIYAFLLVSDQCESIRHNRGATTIARTSAHSQLFDHTRRYSQYVQLFVSHLPICVSCRRTAKSGHPSGATECNEASTGQQYGPCSAVAGNKEQKKSNKSTFSFSNASRSSTPHCCDAFKSKRSLRSSITTTTLRQRVLTRRWPMKVHFNNSNVRARRTPVSTTRTKAGVATRSILRRLRTASCAQYAAKFTVRVVSKRHLLHFYVAILLRPLQQRQLPRNNLPPKSAHSVRG